VIFQKFYVRKREVIYSHITAEREVPDQVAGADRCGDLRVVFDTHHGVISHPASIPEDKPESVSIHQHLRERNGIRVTVGKIPARNFLTIVTIGYSNNETPVSNSY